MDNEFEKFKKLKVDYLYLLEISPQGEEKIKLFESQSIPMKKLRDYVIFLENEIAKLNKA